MERKLVRIKPTSLLPQLSSSFKVLVVRDVLAGRKPSGVTEGEGVGVGVVRLPTETDDPGSIPGKSMALFIRSSRL